MYTEEECELKCIELMQGLISGTELHNPDDAVKIALKMIGVSAIILAGIEGGPRAALDIAELLPYLARRKKGDGVELVDRRRMN